MDRSSPRESVVAEILDLESEEGFFDVAVRGTPVWERLRSLLPRKILRDRGVVGQAHGSGDRNTHRSGSKWHGYAEIVAEAAGNIVRNNPYRLDEHDLFIWGHQRRKQLEDGYWWDIYTDPLHQELNLDYVQFEKDHNGQHLRPAKTSNLYSIEPLKNYAKVLRKLGYGPDIRRQELEPVREIERKVQSTFGFDLDYADGRARKFEIEFALRRVYRAYLEQVDPELVVVVVSYGKEPFILECKEMGIPVAELQHGVIHPQHLGYTYPGDRTKEAFPDYLLVWGEFWRECTEFPIPDERVIPVGYPYLDRQTAQYADVESEDKLLFISQGTIGEQLSNLALEVADHPEIDYEVVYKLHPGEYGRWREEYPWLVDADFRVVDSSEPPLYQLFAESSAQVGVGSTAVYEGLAFDLETFVYDCPGAHVLQPLVEEGTAELVGSAADIAATLGGGTVDFERERFFRPNATGRMGTVLERLQRANATFRT